MVIGDMETQDYSYNIRGRLTGINQPYAEELVPSNAHFFGEALKYDYGFGIASNTIKKYLLRFISLKIALDYIDKLTDHELDKLFADKDKEEAYITKCYNSQEALLSYWEKSLKRKEVTRFLLFITVQKKK